MAVSFADLKVAVARKLGVISLYQPLPSEYAEVIAEKALSLKDELATLVDIDIEQGVDHQYADIIEDMLAAMLVEVFQVPEPRATVIRNNGQLGLSPVSPAEARLRKQLFLGATGQPVQAEYF